MATSENSKNNIKEIMDWVAHIAIAVIIGAFIVIFIGQRTIVHDISMEPTLSDGDNLIVEKLSPRFGWLKRGDIIVFKSPESDRQLIKRLVAFEGEKVEIKDGKVYVNDELFLTGLPEEPETPQGPDPTFNSLIVPEGHVYVLGDNRSFSLDSNDFGPIDKKWIKGKAIFRFYPFGKIGGM